MRCSIVRYLHKKKKKNLNLQWGRRVNGWSDIVIFLIKNKPDATLQNAYQALEELLIAYRFSQGNVIEYTYEINKAIISVNSAICQSPDRAYSFLNTNDLLSVYSGKQDFKQNSESLRKIIWRCLGELLYYKRNDILIDHWVLAVQRMELYLDDRSEKNVSEKYKSDYTEFYLAFGAHALHLERKELLTEMMFYSSIQPPEYKLIPSTFSELFQWLIKVRKDPFIDEFLYEKKYPFYGDRDALNSVLVRNKMMQYIAILFLRLECIPQIYINQNIFSFDIPENLTRLECKEYMDACKYLLEVIDSVKLLVQDYGIFKNSKYKSDTDIVQVVNRYLNDLNQKDENLKNKLEVSSLIIDSYKHTIVENIDKTYFLYQFFLSSKTQIPLFDRDNPLEAYKKNIFPHNASFMSDFPLSYFQENQLETIANLPETIAAYVSSSMRYNIAMTFYSRCGKTKSVYREDLKKAWERLAPSLDKYEAIYIGNKSYVEELFNIILNKHETVHNGDQIVFIPGCQSFNSILLFLKKNELPKLQCRIPMDDTKKKFGLEPIITTSPVFFGFKDLGKVEKLRNEVAKSKKVDPDSLNRSLFLNVYLYYDLYIPENSIVEAIHIVDSFSSEENMVDKLNKLP
jgi:hypothetical protein